LYESKPCYFSDPAGLFATTVPQTYATVYRNQVWENWLIPIANMDPKDRKTALEFRSPQALGILPKQDYVLFDVRQRLTKALTGANLNQAFSDISIPGQSLHLFCLCAAPAAAPFHLWGGKRLSETWDAKARKLTFTVHGPAGLQDTLFLGGAKHGLQEVLVGGKPAPFFFDPAQGLAHGLVTFVAEPLRIEVLCSPEGANRLPERRVSSGLAPLVKERAP
jgi:hypothetical protein